MWNSISFWIPACLIASLIIWRIFGSSVAPSKSYYKYIYIIIGILVMAGLGWYSMNKKDLNYNSKFDPIQTIANGSGFITNDYKLIVYSGDPLPLLGNVKSVTQETFNANDNMGVVEQGKKWDSWNINIDIEGKGSGNEIVTIADHNNKGVLISKTIYKFNENGNLFLSESLDPRDSLLSRTKYIYGQDNILNEYIYYEKKVKIATIYKINNNIVTGASLVENDTIYNILNYTYDSQGRIKKTEYYSNIDDYIVAEEEYEYDEKQTKYKFVKYFDKEHQQIIEIKEKIYSNSGLVLEWNSRGSQNGDYIQKYVRQFDKHGNWTKTIAYEKGTPVYIAYRKITYDE